MTFLDEIRDWFGNVVTGRWQKRSLRPRRGVVESLEVRALLATFNVTNLNDAGDGSLRKAISDANAAQGADSIDFATTGLITLSTGMLEITDSVTITGPGAGSLTISGNNTANRILLISDSTAGLINVSISGVTFRDAGDRNTNISGGAINNAENLTLTNVDFISNHSGAAGHSGALAHSIGTLLVTSCRFTDNNAGLAGGGAIGIFSGTATITGSTLSNNTSQTSGGAIRVNGGTVEIRQSTISGNTAVRNGTGTGFGGGLFHNTGSMTIRHSTISGNTAYSGGGIINFGGTGMLIENTTISGNSETGYAGGGIFSQAPLTIRNSTITDNTSDHSGGVFSRDITTSELVIQNSIIARNKQPNGTPTDLRGTTPTISHSLVGVNTDTTLMESANPDSNGNLIGSSTPINPLLGPLAFNGGPTQTHALLTGSPAINRGNNASLNELTTDQRGNPIARIAGTTVDMGAYELFTVANPIVVSTTRDELDGDISSGDLSLREAIVLANSSPGANTITFATTTNGTEIDLSLGQMEISETVSITGNGSAASMIDAQQNSRIFDITSTAGDVTLSSLMLKNGKTTARALAGRGGAVRSLSSGTLTISQSTLSGNSTAGSYAYGGAISAVSGAVTVSQSTLSGNSTAGQFAGGGAIYARNGAVTVSQSTLSGNSTMGGIAGGGAIIAGFGAVTVSQSTLSGNSTAGYSAGGGAIFVNSGAVTVSQSTLTLNRATQSEGGGIFSYYSPVTIRNSIVAGNTDQDGAPDIRKSPDTGAPFTVTNSLIGRSNGTGLTATVGSTPDASGNFVGGGTDVLKINPQLGPLANNGGPTQTHALLTGSLAIDRGSNALAVDVTNGNTALVRDQRGVGFNRILDGDSVATAIVDMGAVEFSGLRLTGPSPTTNALRPTLTWTAIAGATSYNIWINNESTGQARYYLSTSTATSQSVTSDFAIGKYRVQIQPVFGATVGNWNPPTSIFVLPPVVLATMPAVQLVSRPVISWNALPGAVKYDLWIDNVTTGQKQFVRQNVTGTSFTPSADLPMGIYRVWVRAVDKIGNSGAWSVRYDARVLPGATPIGPLSSTFDRTPTFSWQPVTGAVSYEVYVRNSSAVNVINGQSTTATNLTRTVNLPDGSYRWWVIAVGATGLKSGGATTTDLFVGGRPTVVAPVVGSSSSNRTPTFTWKAVDGAVSYNLQVNRVDVATPKIIFRTGLTGTSFTATSALPAGTYRVWVQAVSPTQSSLWSIEFNTLTFTITATSPMLNPLDDEHLLTGLLKLQVSKKTAVDVHDAPSLPPGDVVDQENIAIDQIMAQIYGERQGVSPPSNSPWQFDRKY